MWYGGRREESVLTNEVNDVGVQSMHVVQEIGIEPSRALYCMYI